MRLLLSVIKSTCSWNSQDAPAADSKVDCAKLTLWASNCSVVKVIFSKLAIDESFRSHNHRVIFCLGSVACWIGSFYPFLYIHYHYFSMILSYFVR